MANKVKLIKTAGSQTKISKDTAQLVSDSKTKVASDGVKSNIHASSMIKIESKQLSFPFMFLL